MFHINLYIINSLEHSTFQHGCCCPPFCMWIFIIFAFLNVALHNETQTHTHTDCVVVEMFLLLRAHMSHAILPKMRARNERAMSAHMRTNKWTNCVPKMGATELHTLFVYTYFTEMFILCLCQCRFGFSVNGIARECGITKRKRGRAGERRVDGARVHIFSTNQMNKSAE